MADVPAQEGPATSRLMILILGLLTALGPLAIDLYLPGLARISHDLRVGPGAAQRTVAVFFFGMGVGQLFVGPLSDRKGRQMPLRAGLALFVAASAGCAVAPSITVLMMMRLFQAVGGCAGLVVARAIVRDRFAAQETARIYAMLTLILGVSPIVAPLVGGWLMLFTGWRMIFWLLAGLGAVLLLLVIRFIPESRSLDAAALARTETPYRSYQRLFGNRRVMGFVWVGAFAGATMPIYVSSAPSVLIGGYGISVQNFGWFFGINGLGLVLGSHLSGPASRRYPAHALLHAADWSGLVLSAIMLIDALTGFGRLYGVLVPLFGVIALLGFSQPNALAGAMAGEPQRAGSVAALLGCSQFIIGAICSTVASALIDGSAVPMAATLLATTAVAVAMFSVIRPGSAADGV